MARALSLAAGLFGFCANLSKPDRPTARPPDLPPAAHCACATNDLVPPPAWPGRVAVVLEVEPPAGKLGEESASLLTAAAAAGLLTRPVLVPVRACVGVVVAAEITSKAVAGMLAQGAALFQVAARRRPRRGWWFRKLAVSRSLQPPAQRRDRSVPCPAGATNLTCGHPAE